MCRRLSSSKAPLQGFQSWAPPNFLPAARLLGDGKLASEKCHRVADVSAMILVDLMLVDKVSGC